MTAHRDSNRCLVEGECIGQLPGRLNSLCRLENGFPNRLGICNGQEEVFRIEIIFAGFVDDTDLTMLEGIGIRKGNGRSSVSPEKRHSLCCPGRSGIVLERV